MKKLLLFDIDGTLIRSNGAGRAALEAALHEIFGTSGPSDSYPFDGKTDPRIITDLLTAVGINHETIQSQLPTVYERMTEKAHTFFAEKRITICPGVEPLLAALRGQPDVVLGLLTGNINTTAPLKLAAAGLDPTNFQVGAYGSDDADRNRLPMVAMQKAAELTGCPFDGHNTVIIGDTPADILCARAGKTTAVAVATGRHSVQTLTQYQPDYVLENFLDTTAVLDILLQRNKE